MDRNTVTGLVLIAVILIVYSMYTSRQMAEQQRLEKLSKDSTEVTTYNPPTSYLDTLPEQKRVGTERPAKLDTTESKAKKQEDFGPFYEATQGEEKLYTIENDKIKLTLSNKGGIIQNVELKDYLTSDSLPLMLFKEGDHHNNIQFFIQNNRMINTSDLFFEAKTDIESSTLTFRLPAGEGKYFEQTYSINKGRKYLIDYDISLVGFDEIIPRNANYLNLYWEREIRQLEKNKESENMYTSLFYKYTNDDIGNLSETGQAEESLPTSVSWISFKQQFFNSTLINKDGFYNGTVKSNVIEEPDILKNMEASVILSYNHKKEQTYSMQYYLGPNHYQTLKSLDIDLEEIVMVTGFMSWVSVINKWIIIPLFNFLNQFISNYGLIILILTLIIKIVLFPLTYRSYKSTAMMKLLKPELDELKEKHKDDQQKFASEQWKLFQSAGVSPMGGCLPMVLQMPILIAMYYFFPTSIELRQESFLWATDLSTYDSILDLPFTIPFYGDHVSLFTLLMTVSSILYAATNPQMATGPASMKYMPYIFPIMLLGIFNSFPAALTYYYFLANIISYLQQFIIKKFIIDDDALHKKLQENKKKPPKRSGFQKRLEDMAKQQRQMQKQRNKKK